MKEELNNKLIESIDLITQWVEAGGQFVAEQTPLIVNEILLYRFWESLIFFILWTVASAILMSLSLVFYNKSKDDDDEFLIASVFFAVTACVVFAMSLDLNLDWLKIKVAPRLYIIEYLAELTKIGS